MSLRHAVLGLLATQPATGYELAAKFDRSLANAWHASHSQIYPELAKLQDAGMVEVVGEGARRSRTYAVTDAGREELRRWLVEGDANRHQRNETAVRWFLLFLLEPADRRRALERELAALDANEAMLRETAERIDSLPGSHPFRPNVDLGLRVGDVMRTWLREQLDAAGDDGGT
ncbi:MAG TPA: PadR family transcriptional regulator [Baekduia sp.]|nr:PadR family transcriptional regulator [Baekduia sp.]